MRYRILLFILTCCFVGNTHATDKNNSYTLYLVRHAEKQLDGSRDPVLTVTGENRAEQLANWFQHKDIRVIWSSDYHRTRDTAKPLLSRLGLKLSIYDPGDLPGLASQLLQKQRTALIVGHSNTTPDLARLLCDCFIEDMDESEHDRLIVVTIDSTGTKVKTLQQHQLFQP